VSRRAKASCVAAYFGCAAVSLLAATLLLRLWRMDLRVPLDYSGDALQYEFVIKSVIDHGWYLTNPDIGAPNGLQLYDFPVCANDTVHLLLIKGMSLFSRDWALLTNLYFLLGFPLISVSALAVFRRYRVAYAPAIAGAVLYSFLPSRLFRGETQLFLDMFYVVPLLVLVVLWVCSDHPPLTREGRGFPRIALRRGRSLAALGICVLSGSSSLYYSFFAACLLLVGGFLASFDRRSTRNARSGLLLAAVLGATVVANLLPTFVYQARHGANAEVTVRPARDAEIFGMKVAPLLLPVDGHRIDALRHIKEHYDGGAPRGETTATSLGVVGSVGFLFLLGSLLMRALRKHEAGNEQHTPDGEQHGEVLRWLAVLNVVAVLLGTIGGFGSLIALLITPQIRVYSRLSVFIGFLALFAMVLLLDRLVRRLPRASTLAPLLVLAVGLLDEVPPMVVRPYAGVARWFASDADFVHRIEATLEPGSIVFQLPYMRFPEGMPLLKMGEYDLLRPYLHSRSLRWSFPAVRGRSGDVWMQDMAEREPVAMVRALADAGVKGIMIDRDGCADSGAAIESALSNWLHAQPLVANETRFSFFDISAHTGLWSAGSERAREIALHPPVASWVNGCYPSEATSEKDKASFRWCSGSGEITIDNETPYPRRITLSMTFFAARPPAQLTLEGDLFSVDLKLPPDKLPFARDIDLSPGRHTIRFHCDGRPADAPGDRRTLVWGASFFRLDEALPSDAP
jgi:hypothetical protein